MMIHRLLQLIHHMDVMKNDPNWQQTLMGESKSKAKIAAVIFAVVIVLLLVSKFLAH